MPGKQNAVHDTIHGNMYGPDVGIQAEHWHGGMCLVGNIPVQAVAVMHRYTVYNVYTIYATNTA